MAAVGATHEMHRRALEPLSRFFSVKGITAAENRVVARVQKLGERIKNFGTDQVMSLSNGLSSLTTDIISCIIFDEPSDYLSDPTFNEAWYKTLNRGTLSVPLFAHIPFMHLFSLPVINRITKWNVWDDKATRQILVSKLKPSDEAKTRDETTVFDHLVHSEVKEEMFGKRGFKGLAQLIQQAGAHNLAFTICTIITHLLLDPVRLQKLRDELKGYYDKCPGRIPEWKELRQAKYLGACIKEGLR